MCVICYGLSWCDEGLGWGEEGSSACSSYDTVFILVVRSIDLFEHVAAVAMRMTQLAKGSRHGDGGRVCWGSGGGKGVAL